MAGKLSKPKVLIIEDDRWLADIYRDVLKNYFKVRVEHDGQSAIESLDNITPDVILLDIMLPGGNGVAFLQELRSYDDTIKLPVLVITGTKFSNKQRWALGHYAPISVMDKADLTPENLKSSVEKLTSK